MRKIWSKWDSVDHLKATTDTQSEDILLMHYGAGLALCRLIQPMAAEQDSSIPPLDRIKVAWPLYILSHVYG